MINDDGLITLTIREYMDYGLIVFDRNSEKIGTVFAYETGLGYMTVRPHPLSHQLLHVPFSVITHIDPREIFVSSTREEAHRLFRDPPPRSTLVQERTDPITGEDDSHAITTEPSGYDGRPIIVDQAKIDHLRKRIATGDHVLTSDTVDLGTVKQYDPVTGWMLVERRDLSGKHDLMVPVTVADYVDRDDQQVYLAVSQADLQRMQHLEPTDVVFVQSEVKTSS
jgi:hypothetical protein